MVRLKVGNVRAKNFVVIYFNSNMVRLKEEVEELSIDVAIKFQFQYGSIKSSGMSEGQLIIK